MLTLTIFSNGRLSKLTTMGFTKVVGRQKMSSPVRSVEAIEGVYFDNGPLSAPEAVIYRAQFADGTAREIFVLGDPTSRKIDSAIYLRNGRTTDQLHEIKSLMIEGEEGIVPDSVKEVLRRYEANRDLKAAQYKLG